MSTEDFVAAVRRVLPALNLEPARFSVDSGFIDRALRRGVPRSLVLNDPATQSVFVGRRPTTEPDAIVDQIGPEALASLPGHAREACERLLAVWTTTGNEYFAATWDVRPDGSLGTRTAMSWSAPQEWPEPMFDWTQQGEEALNDALRRLEAVVGARRSRGFDAALARAFRLVDLILVRFKGEGPDTTARPSPHAPDTSWASWLEHYTTSVRSELARVRPDHAAPPRRAPTAPSGGVLSSRHVFLSYARPDAATLAWPIRDALQACGATVWFDQERSIDAGMLDAGLDDAIRSCDTYILCLSDELIERSGYATQEAAWAINAEPGGALRYFLIVSRPHALIPTALQSWPHIEFHDDQDALADLLAACLTAPPPAVAIKPARAAAASAAPISLDPLPDEADMAVLRRRVQHVRAFDQIDQQAITALISGDDGDRHTMVVRRRLLGIAEELLWDGTLEHIDQWAASDPFVADLRLRLAAARAVVGLRIGLTGEVGEDPEVRRDVEWLATQPAPILNWPPVAGWDDVERRFALRSHSSTLRVLQQMLHRGLTGGLVTVRSSTLDEWEHQTMQRRRECYDALLSLRLGGRLGWQREPPTWDALFRPWLKLLTEDANAWSTPVPPFVLQMLVANAEDVAAVAAHTAWSASRSGRRASQTFTSRWGIGTLRIEVFALSMGTERSTGGADNSLRIGIAPSGPSSGEVQLSWEGTGNDGEPLSQQSGFSTRPAPGQLLAALSFAST